MPLTKLTINGENVPFDRALELARAGETDLPYPFLKAVVAGIQQRQTVAKEEEVSVTDVIGCPRAKYLRATEEYAEKPEDLMAAFRGTLLHQLLAKFAEEEATVETRTSRDFAGHTLRGTADSIITTRTNGRYRLRDFKSTKRIPQYGPWPNHVQQINLYRWLYELPAKGTDMSVIYFDLNGAEVGERAVKARDYWSDAQVEEFLQKRFVPLAESLRDKKLPLYRDVPADLLLWMCAWCPVYEQCYNKLLEEPGALPIFAQAARGRKK